MSLDQVIRAYETALNANATDTILGFYSAEPVFMPPGAPALVGRAAVRAGYEHVFNTLKLHMGFAVTLAGVTVATGGHRIVAADQDGVLVVPLTASTRWWRGWRPCARPKPGWTPRCVRA